MADLTQKKDGFTRRWIAAIDNFMKQADDLEALNAEWNANAYATGADPLTSNITDEDLARVAPWIDALALNQSIGAMQSVRAVIESNRGYLEAVRP